MSAEVHDDKLERPRVFGDYHLLATLARGGMGTILLAKRIGFRADIQRFCVVKKMRAGLGQAWVRRFHDEARIVVTLNHRAVCHVFDVGVVDGEHYLAMELIEGVSLNALMEANAKVPAGLALYILDEVLDALEYAHGHKDPASGAPLLIVHRDVSPHNVMLSFHGGVKLIDFGLVSSTVKQERTFGGAVVGKLGYMSPEQARGEPLDARTDVYAAAVILFELLSGQRFYGELSKNMIMMQLVDGTYQPPFDLVEPALREVLRRALDSDRERRTASCAQLQAELAAAGVPRATSRELRELVRSALPREQERLESIVRGAADAGNSVTDVSPDAQTVVTHIARSDPALSGASLSSASEPAAELTATMPLGLAPRAPRSAPTSSPRLSAGSALTALAVALLSGAACVALWLALRDAPPDVAAAPSEAGTTRSEPATTPPSAGAAQSEAGTARSEPAPPPPSAGTAQSEAGTARSERTTTSAPTLADASAPDIASEPEIAQERSRATSRAKKSAPRPPVVALPDLAAHLDYLKRWCTERVPCARPLAASRSRIALLDVVGLRALRSEAEQCVAECRR